MELLEQAKYWLDQYFQPEYLIILFVAIALYRVIKHIIKHGVELMSLIRTIINLAIMLFVAFLVYSFIRGDF